MTKDCINIIIENAINNSENFAIIDGVRKVTYPDFVGIVNSISNNLILFHSNPKVILDLGQSIESYALIVAVLNVGGVFCPLNIQAPIDRKKQIVEEFQPDLVVVESEEKKQQFNTSNVISINHLIKTNLNKINISYNQESTIYVMYTSGSTGSPKGVKVSRKALNKFLEWSIPTFGAKANDIWGQFSLLSFDLSIVDIFTCLCSGATLVVMNDTGSKLRPSNFIERNKISIWHSIPSAIEFMIKNDDSHNADFSSIKLMSFCGEPLKKHHLDYLFKKNKNIRVFNTYGPTEGTLFCTWQEFNINNYLNFCESSMSIGKSIPGWNIFLKPIDNSEEQEIIIYGDYIAQGYLANNSDSKFKAANINGSEVNTFETGDLVFEKNGNLYFSCRIDKQIKIKGHRIELDEIDYMINRLTGKVSVTLAKDNFLYSFIETDELLNENEIKKLLSQKIEPFKIPNIIFSIKELPRNSNFKINYIELQKLIP